MGPCTRIITAFSLKPKSLNMFEAHYKAERDDALLAEAKRTLLPYMNAVDTYVTAKQAELETYNAAMRDSKSPQASFNNDDDTPSLFFSAASQPNLGFAGVMPDETSDTVDPRLCGLAHLGLTISVIGYNPDADSDFEKYDYLAEFAINLYLNLQERMNGTPHEHVLLSYSEKLSREALESTHHLSFEEMGPAISALSASLRHKTIEIHAPQQLAEALDVWWAEIAQPQILRDNVGPRPRPI